MPPADDPSAMARLLEARRRYVELRDALPCDCAIDRDLRAELTEAIRAIDAKIAGTDPANDPDPPPCAFTPGGRSATARRRARHRRSGR
jgi:hypothetical protein